MKKKKLLKTSKTLSFIIVFITLTIASCKNETIVANNASINFSKTSHDFGELSLKKEASFDFTFENNGKEPLKISDVQTSCGCTISNWPKKIIKPNQKETVTVTYDAAYPGRFQKTITVYYNGKNSPIELQITGQVQYPKENTK